MTNNILEFAVLRYQPDIARQEIVNVGSVVFTVNGPVLTVAPNLTKLLALDPNTSLLQVQERAADMQHALRALSSGGSSPAQMVAMFAPSKAGFTMSALGVLDSTDQELSDVINELQRDLVLSPPKKRQSTPRSSRLHTELRAMFKSAKILGKSPGDISQHLVVPNYPIDADVGLYAEFALRNGKLRVTETLDFRNGDHTLKKREAESKTLLLLQALERVGRDDLHRYVVVSGASEKTQTSINLLSRYADDLIVRESAEDWGRYITSMAEAAKNHAH